MTLSQRLALHPGVYFGTGDGIESGPFVSRIEIRVMPNGGVSIDYEATSYEQGVQHREHSMLVGTPDGGDRLVIAHAESPFLTDLVETAAGSGHFDRASASGAYAMAVVVEHPSDDRITYAWWWAPDGERPVEQSKADARRS